MDVDYRPSEIRHDARKPAPRIYWIVATGLMLWGVGYALLIAEALFIMRPEDFDRLVSPGMILPGYGDYVQRLPTWIVALIVVKAITRLAGAGALLLRRRGAVPFYSLSLAVSFLIFFRGFLFDNRGDYEGATLIGLDALFFFLSVYALYFAIRARFGGLLR